MNIKIFKFLIKGQLKLLDIHFCCKIIIFIINWNQIIKCEIWFLLLEAWRHDVPKNKLSLGLQVLLAPPLWRTIKTHLVVLGFSGKWKIWWGKSELCDLAQKSNVKRKTFTLYRNRFIKWTQTVMCVFSAFYGDGIKTQNGLSGSSLNLRRSHVYKVLLQWRHVSHLI